MKLILTYTLMIYILMTIILLFIPLLNYHKQMDREKNSPFECGFDPFSHSRTTFSIHFFTVSLMFLIFDIEITLIMPIPIMKKLMHLENWMMFCLIVSILLLMGLIMEWKEGSMEWK
uniref:NADH-ubiquinone oxidoreductase chain 3 n=1 Tax=Aacanthocnema dobsoni TaxID=399255 RepID=A0A344A211_9HEMI|nr:NADH dehydrogenase subunit 3 [Aacanthocnema dobsoni]AWU48802.1 NADH dehydrogenase subunit 3 [Aacanthocnema dobsoni]